MAKIGKADSYPLVTKTLPVGDFATQLYPSPQILAPIGDDKIAVQRFRKLREHDALFLTFAEIASVTDLQHFTNCYGDETTVTVFRILKFHGGAGFDLEIPLDPFTQHVNTLLWMGETKAMRRCLKLLELVRSGDGPGLKGYVRWVEKDGEVSVCIAWPPENSSAKASPGSAQEEIDVVASTSVRPEILAECPTGNPVNPALFYIQGVINDRISTMVESRVLWDIRRKAMCLHFVPRDLLGGLWLQIRPSVRRKQDF